MGSATASQSRKLIAKELVLARHPDEQTSEHAAASVAIPTLAALGLQAKTGLQRGGERAANNRLKHFLQERRRRYDDAREGGSVRIIPF
jgi:deoxyribodipyrimidine photolyase